MSFLMCTSFTSTFLSPRRPSATLYIHMPFFSTRIHLRFSSQTLWPAFIMFLLLIVPSSSVGTLTPGSFLVHRAAIAQGHAHLAPLAFVHVMTLGGVASE
ncbi:hypothetical protein EDB86DRAFT_2872504, partial [Lactarius hatsudake]